MMALALPAQTVRVIFVSGQASLQRPDEVALRPALKGETVIIGTRIVTGADGRVVLTPMPGVKSIITPNTTLVLESVSETRTSATEVTHQAVLDLKQGAVVSDLQKPEGVTYDYSIRTARGLAGARGTTFTVGINLAGIQTVVVAHGSISITFTDGSKAVLTPGQLSITKANGETESVNNIGELSEADQKIAKNWTEITIAAIATALEAGIELDPTALNNALDAAKSLGITLSPETQAAVDRALATVPPLNEPTTTDDVTTSEIVTEISGPTPLELFRARLTADQVIAFDTLPADIQGQLVTLNDLDIAGIALAPDPQSGLPNTYQDLRTHLAAFNQLSADARVFVKILAGSNFAGFESAPNPVEWSPSAFQRTLESWNSLNDTERTLITTLGAGKAIMDTSAGYISALLNELTLDQRTLITETGWGAYLGELAGKPTSQNIFDIAGNSLDDSERAAVKFFHISPEYFRTLNTIDLVGALADLSASDQQILRQLGISDVALDPLRRNNQGPIITSKVFIPDFAVQFTQALAFYSSLSAGEKTAARALGLGYLLYHYAPGAFIGDSNVTALQRVQTLAQFYNDNPGLQQALRDSALFSHPQFLEDSSPLNVTLITTTLNTYRNLPERTRTYLAAQDHSQGFFQLANPDLVTGLNTSRTLAEINSILGALSPSEFSTLLDLGLGRVVTERGDGAEVVVPFPFISGSPTDEIKATIGNYNQLDSAKKYVLRELGIVGDGNVAMIGADTEGLDRLLTAYATVPGTLRATTEQLDEGASYSSTYGSTFGASKDRSFFFPRGYYASTTMIGVGFESTGDLHVGATRYLRIDGSLRDGDTFVAGAGKDVYLHASDLIDLNSTGVSANIRSITMAAATINLANIIFPEGSVASLNSKLGMLNFGASTNNGKVNFTNVRYGNSDSYILDADNFASESRGNIAIGTLANPAALPAYTAPVFNVR